MGLNADVSLMRITVLKKSETDLQKILQKFFSNKDGKIKEVAFIWKKE